MLQIGNRVVACPTGGPPPRFHIGTHVPTVLGLFRGGRRGARLTAWGQGAVRGGFPVLRILLSVGNIVFSLILGALLLAFVAIYSPERLSTVIERPRSFQAVVSVWRREA